MTSLGYSLVSGNNQVLQHNLPGANPSGAHFSNPVPQFASNVEAVAGCGGAGGSAAALAAHPGYNVEAKPQSGGNDSQRRGGSKRRHGGKRHSSKRHGGKRHSSKRHGGKRRSSKRHGGKRHSRRHMRGGLSGLSPDSFSGAANLPYHQFTGSQPLSFNYGLGSQAPLAPALSGMANPPPMMNIHNNCGSDHGLVGKGLLN